MRNLLVLAVFLIGGVAGPFAHHALLLHGEPTLGSQATPRSVDRPRGESEGVPQQPDSRQWQSETEDCVLCASFILSGSGLSSPSVRPAPPETGVAVREAGGTELSFTSRLFIRGPPRL